LDPGGLRQTGLLQVVDPDTAVSIVRKFTDKVPITHFHGLPGIGADREVVDPDTAVSIVRKFTDKVPITHFHGLPPGLPPRWAQTHLELFASKVVPAFR
jgi:hypothetical protein